MPYSMDNPPEKISKMPKHAQEIFVAAFNAAIVDDPDEGRANAIAYAAVKRDYEQDASGEWHAKEKQAPLTVFKQANGKYRWILFSSSSYEDREREIVSQKALEGDTERMDTTGDYGTLDWWHLFGLDGELVDRPPTISELGRIKPVKLGTCDFSAMHGNISIETGEFDDAFIGERVAAKAGTLAASRAFLHPVNEPDAERVYNHIQTFSRAILPRGKESNLLTAVFVSQEENQMNMLEEKVKQLKTLLGGDKAAEAKVDELLTAATAVDKEAEAAQIKHKEDAPTAEPEAVVKDKEPWFLADMKPEEFTTLVAKAVATALEPTLAEIKAAKEAQTIATKESGNAIVQEIAKMVIAQSQMDGRLKNLEGETPRAFRASQDPSTVTTDAALKAKKPVSDDAPFLATFIANMAKP